MTQLAVPQPGDAVKCDWLIEGVRCTNRAVASVNVFLTPVERTAHKRACLEHVPRWFDHYWPLLKNSAAHISIRPVSRFLTPTTQPQEAGAQP